MTQGQEGVLLRIWDFSTGEVMGGGCVFVCVPECVCVVSHVFHLIWCPSTSKGDPSTPR